jgi:hypothetical protein
MSIISGFRKLRQEDHVVKTSLSDTVSKKQKYYKEMT